MKKRLKTIAIVGLLAVIALQFTNPSHQNPLILTGHDLFATNAPPPFIAAILRNSCYDCHSFETKWPWESYVAPISWLIVRDVEAARSNLNFSDWPHDDARRASKRWRHIAEEVENSEMPPRNYTRMHRLAHLDERQRAELIEWAKERAHSTTENDVP